ncbi:FtsX-like permease family protein [Uliginosibacterium sp. H3]|uniref:FtsX-like permease family protein n=1 Tax=Uliginosibacterium silvisoli TaxID=3114758 RepID=A0ABU6K6E3_9RHOO|nr:FtsX-like permease family protein [Uliginosibacterium sp. H3]
MIALTLALRNLWKNRRRSLATLLAIAIGFAAINLFAGYIHNVYNGLRVSAMHGEGLGHLTIAKRGFFEEGSLKPERFVFSRDELARLGNVLQQQTDIAVISPRLSVSGLVSNGKLSTIFIAEGEDPDAANRMWRRGIGLPKLDAAKPNAGLVSKKLAAMLGAEPGSDLVTFTSTLAGQTNALDLEMLKAWDTGTAATNDKSLRLPLSYVQRLLDTDGATRIVLLFKDGTDADAVRATLAPQLKAAGFDVDIKTWVELSNFYRQVKNLFDLIFLFLFSIVFIVVLMSIVNTLSMSVMERVREIGTLRALGMRRRGIVSIFAVEGATLGALGCLIGIVISVALGMGITAGQFTYTPPSSSSPVPLSIAILPVTLAATLALLSLVSMIAACWPARRAAHIEIVDALGHV